MRVGVVFPQLEIGNDGERIREYARTVEQLGYTHLLAYDHVLGANPDRPGGWAGPYTHHSPFHEVFILLSHLAAVTRTLELGTGVLVLPQRQTALVAKQAASLDVLSGGRLRLGVGLGWNHVEYEALGEDFHTRGRRVSEQIELMRKLWAGALVTFEGRWHHVDDAGINPLPVRRSIPVWMGANSDVALRRVARIADGWMANTPAGDALDAQLERMRGFLADAGRESSELGLEGRVHWKDGADKLLADLDVWERKGATHVSVNTMGAGLDSPAAHLDALRTVAERRGLSA